MKVPGRTTAKAFATRALALLAQALRGAVAPLLWFLLMGIGGAVLVVSGVYVLQGPGWALIAAGVFSLFGAALIGRAMTHE